MHRLSAFTLIALLLVAAGCSSPAAKPAGNVTVEIRGFQFTPAVLEISRGTTVTWINRDDVLHTATAGTAVKKDNFGTYEKDATGAFDGRMDKPGDRYGFAFAEPGEYAYFCDRHAHMVGKVVVR